MFYNLTDGAFKAFNNIFIHMFTISQMDGWQSCLVIRSQCRIYYVVYHIFLNLFLFLLKSEFQE